MPLFAVVMNDKHAASLQFVTGTNYTLSAVLVNRHIVSGRHISYLAEYSAL